MSNEPGAEVLGCGCIIYWDRGTIAGTNLCQAHVRLVNRMAVEAGWKKADGRTYLGFQTKTKLLEKAPAIGSVDDPQPRCPKCKGPSRPVFAGGVGCAQCISCGHQWFTAKGTGDAA